MNLRFHSQGLTLTSADEAKIGAQLEKALHSFADRIRAIDVYVKDINGPRGGPDKSVVIRARLGGRTELTASALRANLYSATAVAARRAKRQVKRALRRQRSFEKFALGQSNLGAEPGLDGAGT